LENDPQGMIDVVAKVAGSLRNPTRTPNDILTGLGLAGARSFAARVRSLLASPQPSSGSQEPVDGRMRDPDPLGNGT
ncbi:MAG: hypothetical protein LBO20_05630, partial [Bifidobacteriaceae bacterium]|nr:hypothetical protein [Bifidobacteriaceae bacterium]